MHLRPRHYVLLAIILCLFVYNIIRHRRYQQEMNSLSTQSAPVVVHTPRLDTPAWAAFDQLASLRDASSSEYDPALKNLQTLMPLDPNQGDGHLQDIKGCLTWLEYYRHGHALNNPDGQMKALALRHIEDCAKYHQATQE